jgi:hypothetical protein
LHSSQSSQATRLDLGKRPASAQERDEPDNASRRQRLEQVPARVVKEEDALHGENRAVEERMRHRRSTQCLAKVARVGAQGRPHNQKHWQRASYRGSKDNRDSLGGRLGIVTEDVVDLGFGGVAQRRLGNGERDVRIAGHGEVEDLALVGRRGTERSNDDGGGDRLRGSEELVGQVFLGLCLSVGLR